MMATLPKIAPCPRCKTDEHIGICTYDSGWRYVECDKCWYTGPGEGNQRQAIKSHNENVAAAIRALNPGEETPGDGREEVGT